MSPARSSSHGLLFSAPMALANIQRRKTQTRRIIKPQPTQFNGIAGDEWTGWPITEKGSLIKCPYGQTGEEIWQKETVCIAPKNFAPPDDTCIKDADGDLRYVSYKADRHSEQAMRDYQLSWTPSILHPRWATRFTATITGIRAQRLQDITAEDAIAEGLSQITKDDGQTWKWGIPDKDGLPGNDDHGWNWRDWDVDPVQAYRRLWNQINLPPSPVRVQGPKSPICRYVSHPWCLEDLHFRLPRLSLNLPTWRGKPLDIIPNPYVWALTYQRKEIAA